MKEIISTVLSIIIISMIGYSLFLNNKIKTDVDRYYNKIDSIQQEIDSVTLLNLKLDYKIDKADSNILLINEQIFQVDNNINIIKNQTNEECNFGKRFKNR